MSYGVEISFLAALSALTVAVWVLLRWKHNFANFTLVAGMLLLALEAGLTGMANTTSFRSELLRWERIRLLAAALLPGVWLLFSLSFARAGYEATLARWKWPLTGTFVLPLILAVGFGGSLLRTIDIGRWNIALGWSGYALILSFLLSAVVILMNLERTFRASAGAARWEIKFLILGVGTIWAAQIYTASQTLLFRAISLAVETIGAAALVIACAMIGVALWRGGSGQAGFYVSQTVVYNSAVALVVGVYLVIVGLLSKVISYIGVHTYFPIESVVLFIALVGLTVVLLSEDVRQKAKTFLSRHLSRPQFDYRKMWTDFARETSSILDEGQLAANVTNMIARTFGVSAVGVWSWEGASRRLELVNGTFSVESPPWEMELAAPIDRRSSNKLVVCDLSRAEEGWPTILRRSCPEELFPSSVRYAIPMVAGDELLGFITMNAKLTGDPFSPEEEELLGTLSERTAASLRNIQLSNSLVAAREAQAFQKMSAFFVHDLKNMAMSLSLTVKNLPKHFDNAEFRDDALESITHNVDKVNAMCGQLSLLKGAPPLTKEDCDLNDLVESTLAELNGIRPKVYANLEPMARVVIDAEEVKKVIYNLILNASETVGADGRISVRTEEKYDSVVLSVRDNGFGMSREFISNFLFKPFSTTKKHGLGIGLFQCKQIVEAHNGRIEVESEEGKGTTFRVYLPKS